MKGVKKEKTRDKNNLKNARDSAKMVSDKEKQSIKKSYDSFLKSYSYPYLSDYTVDSI